MTDYSQSGEQAAILKALEGVDKGAFLDIGAFSAKTFSNTRALYELGWRGVMVEPSPGPLRNLIQEYGNDKRIHIIGAAVASNLGLIRFSVTDDAVSTSEAGKMETWKERGGYYGSFWVPAITIGAILGQFGAFDFVNIDTEGTSKELLFELLATEMFPKCICVEHDGSLAEIMQRSTERGYKITFATGENLVLSL